MRRRRLSARKRTLGCPMIHNYNTAKFNSLHFEGTAQGSFGLTTLTPSPGQDMTPEEFDRLLLWLNPDRDKAGEKYEWIRKRLIKMFVCRGCTIPEELADRTINRVARKLPEVQSTYIGDPAHYFLGVARNIFLEWIKEDRPPIIGIPTPPPETETDPRHVCLERCLEQLPREEHDLVLSYYEGEGQDKIEHRRMLADRFGLGINALRIRVCRIRAALQNCVERCRCEIEELKPTRGHQP
jgi:DNA-directed RNA polymerase specialized sigma24 family protein